MDSREDIERRATLAYEDLIMYIESILPASQQAVFNAKLAQLALARQQLVEASGGPAGALSHDAIPFVLRLKPQPQGVDSYRNYSAEASTQPEDG